MTLSQVDLDLMCQESQSHLVEFSGSVVHNEVMVYQLVSIHRHPYFLPLF